jgi:hypothetical protein
MALAAEADYPPGLEEFRVIVGARLATCRTILNTQRPTPTTFGLKARIRRARNSLLDRH